MLLLLLPSFEVSLPFFLIIFDVITREDWKTIESSNVKREKKKKKRGDLAGNREREEKRERERE